ncbi:MAG TPA: glycosyltransferase family 1 protein [Vicinamibacterales bacterium]|nr:glycosyltransferase family 1 protein [Vicinamibacterales bacterium]
MPLRIGVDARELLGDTTGVGRYLAELLRRWLARSDASSRQFLLFSPEPLPFVQALSPDPRLVEACVIGRGRGTLWEQTFLRRALATRRPDVFFAPAYTAPFKTSIPMVVTIHDVSFSAHPEWFTRREGARRRLLTRRTARQAKLVLTVSEFSRQEIRHRLGIDEARILTIRSGVTRRPTGAYPREPLVLFAGSLFTRRRLPMLIAAFARAAAARPDARLVIAGANRTYPRVDLRRLAEDTGIGSRIDLRDYVDEAELEQLYGRAAAFAFPSEYEGFGFTPLEALSAGTPVVVLDTPVAREIYGDAACYVDPADDGQGLAAALKRLLDARGAAAASLPGAAEVLSRYSWDTAADRTLAALEQAASR